MPFAKIVVWDALGSHVGFQSVFVPHQRGGWVWHLFIPIGRRVVTLILGWNRA